MLTRFACLLVYLSPNREELRQEFPELEDEDIQQALIFAFYLGDRIIELPNRYETVAPSGITTLCGSIAT